MNEVTLLSRLLYCCLQHVDVTAQKRLPIAEEVACESAQADAHDRDEDCAQELKAQADTHADAQRAHRDADGDR